MIGVRGRRKEDRRQGTGYRGRETRNRDVRHGIEDERQGTKT